MDGLTVKNYNSLLNTGKTASEIKSSQLEKPSVGAPSSTGGPNGPDKSFADTLKEAVGSVNTLQKDADVKMQQLATGQNNNVADVVIAAEKADIALRLMTQVRNKVIDAYTEVMKMQV